MTSALTRKKKKHAYIRHKLFQQINFHRGGRELKNVTDFWSVRAICVLEPGKLYSEVSESFIFRPCVFGNVTHFPNHLLRLGIQKKNRILIYRFNSRLQLFVQNDPILWQGILGISETRVYIYNVTFGYLYVWSFPPAIKVQSFLSKNCGVLSCFVRLFFNKFFALCDKKKIAYSMITLGCITLWWNQGFAKWMHSKGSQPAFVNIRRIKT